MIGARQIFDVLGLPVLVIGILWGVLIWREGAAYDQGYENGEIAGYGHHGADGQPMTGGYAAGFAAALAGCNQTQLQEQVAALTLEKVMLLDQLSASEAASSRIERQRNTAWAEYERLKNESAASDTAVCFSPVVVREQIDFGRCLYQGQNCRNARAGDVPAGRDADAAAFGLPALARPDWRED